MKSFSIYTLGCKVNQYESQQIRQFLEEFGFRQAVGAESADLVLINSCCVTQTASAKSRQRINKARKQNPDAKIIICGCLPVANTNEFKNLGEKNVYLIKNRNNLTFTLTQIMNGKNHNFQYDRTGPQPYNIAIKTTVSSKIKDKSPNFPNLPYLTSFSGQTRAFLKVQDGCDGFCSYCIVPHVRHIIYNKPADIVLKEAQALVNAGHKEIVITGIFLGAYGQKTVRRQNWPDNTNPKLAELLDKIGKIRNLERIRLSSLEPADITEQLLDVLCSNSNFMPHLHLSLQSGSNNILKRMARQYQVEEFEEKISMIRSRMNRPAITCDLIVGFPGESDEDFQKTVEMAEKIGFAKMHIFSFSSREGTAAAKMKPTVEKRIIKERSRILRELESKLGQKFRQQFIGQQENVLIETINGKVGGRSSRYFYVQLNDNPSNFSRNDIIKVQLLENTKTGMLGAVIKK